MAAPLDTPRRLAGDLFRCNPVRRLLRPVAESLFPCRNHALRHGRPFTIFDRAAPAGPARPRWCGLRYRQSSGFSVARAKDVMVRESVSP